jgi:hypothetical protein
MDMPMDFMRAATSGGSLEKSGIAGAAPPIVTVTLQSPTRPWLAKAEPAIVTAVMTATAAKIACFLAINGKPPSPRVYDSASLGVSTVILW